MTNKFSWEKFDYDFLKEIVYNHKTPMENRPQHPVREKERLAIYVANISPEPTKGLQRNTGLLLRI